MRKPQYLFLLIAAFCFSCVSKQTAINEFSSSADTLIIKTEKRSGFGVFEYSAGRLNSKDTSESFLTSIKYPEGFDQLKRYETYIDFALMRYYRFKSGEEHLLEQIMYDIDNSRIDTTICLPEAENIINILDGYRDDIRTVIVDANNNKDLTDDDPYVVDLSWGPIDEGFIEIPLRIYNGDENINDKSWLIFRKFKGTNELLYGKAEHVVAKFQIDDNNYEVAAINLGSSDFTYDLYAPTSHKYVLLDERKAEYDEGEFLLSGHCLNLEGGYYRIDGISHNGEELTLIKEGEFETLVGTQVGMIAPEFECATIFGDTIKSSDFNNTGIIIVNMCGCGGDIETMAAFNSITSKYSEEYIVLGVDFYFSEDQNGRLVNSEDPFNQEFSENFRMDYCSRMTYVIDGTFRIQQKFYTHNWQGRLDT